MACDPDRDVRRRLRAIGCDATRRRPPPAASCRDGSVPRGPHTLSLALPLLATATVKQHRLFAFTETASSRPTDTCTSADCAHDRNSRAARHDGGTEHGAGERLWDTGSGVLVDPARTADRASLPLLPSVQADGSFRLAVEVLAEEGHGGVVDGNDADLVRFGHLARSVLVSRACSRSCELPS